jgi:phosphate-selective porin
MKFRLNVSWLIVGLSLLAPGAYGDDTVPEASQTAPEGRAVLQQRGQDASEDESNEPKATKSEVEAVRDEIQVLRDQWQRSLDLGFPTTVVQANRPLIISGTGQLRFAHNKLFTQSEPAPANTFNSFSIPFFSLIFAGNLKKDYEQGKNLDYQLGIQTTGTSAISITDAWLRYQILNSLDKEGPRLSITAGQQKKSFGNEATATEAFKPTIQSAQFATKLSLDPRDIGLVLAGDILPANDYGYNYRVPAVQYWLGVLNGSGPNTAEFNNEKDFFGRIQLNAPVHYDHLLRGLSLGVSGYKGWNTVSATTTTTNTINNGTGQTVSSSTTATVNKKGDKQRWGADLAYVNTPIGFTLEYVRGKDLTATTGAVRNGVTTAPTRFKTIDEEGYTFTLFYNFGDQFVNAAKQQDRYDDYYPLTYQPFFRYDSWTPDTDTKSIRTDVWTVGFNWFFAQTTKLQLNYNLTRDYKGQSNVTNFDTFLAQFQFGF